MNLWKMCAVMSLLSYLRQHHLYLVMIAFAEGVTTTFAEGVIVHSVSQESFVLREPLMDIVSP